MASPSDIENMRAVYNRVMQAHQLKPQDVKKKYSHIAYSDTGEFNCEGCMFMWRSRYSWVTFDLKNLEIVQRWKMKCKQCMQNNIPTFKKEQLEHMFEDVVDFYKKGPTANPDRDIGYGARKRYQGNIYRPHLPELCEKCKWGFEQCWTRKFYYM